MDIYLAGRYGRREELAGYAKQLEAKGHHVTSRWLAGEHEAKDEKPTMMEAQGWAEHDLDDIEYADWLVAFTEGPECTHARGGRHVELGYAIALSRYCFMRIVIIGPRENVFCNLEEVEQFDSFEDFMGSL